MHYGIALLYITDPAPYDRYRRSFAATLAGTGGRLLAADATPGVLEGEFWITSRRLILRLPRPGKSTRLVGQWAGELTFLSMPCVTCAQVVHDSDFALPRFAGAGQSSYSETIADDHCPQ